MTTVERLAQRGSENLMTRHMVWIVMPSPGQTSLVIDSEAFLGYVGTPLFRDIQMAEIRASYRSQLGHGRPLHIWAHGPSGIGKTFCVRHLLETEVQDAGLLPIYINCRERFTFLDMVEQILDTERVIIAPRRTRERQISLLRSTLAQRRCVIALDEIDILRRGDVADLLHHLLSLPQVSLLCVSSLPLSLIKLPEPILSRLTPRQVRFPRYQRAELLGIVQRAAENVLRPGSWQEATLHKIVGHSNGDARRALALLRHAVQRAEDAGAEVLQPEHLVPVNFDHFTRRVEDELALLSSHHRMLYDLVSSRGPIPATKLGASYRQVCRRQELAPVSARTIHKYLTGLCRKRILHREHGAGTQAWIYRLAGSVTGAGRAREE